MVVLVVEEILQSHFYQDMDLWRLVPNLLNMELQEQAKEEAEFQGQQDRYNLALAAMEAMEQERESNPLSMEASPESDLPCQELLQLQLSGVVQMVLLLCHLVVQVFQENQQRMHFPLELLYQSLVEFFSLMVEWVLQHQLLLILKWRTLNSLFSHLVATGVQQPGGVPTGTGVKAPKPFVPGTGGGYPNGGTYGVPYGAGTGTGAGTRLPIGVGAFPLKPPAVGGTGFGAGIPLAAGSYPGGYSPYHHGYGQGGLTYPSAVGLGGAGGGANAQRPGYGNLGGGGGYQPGAVPVAPGYGGGYPQQYYPGGYVPAPLTPQQAKAAKYGPLQGFLGGAGGGRVYVGGAAGCQGKFCGRRK
ncbi:putative elastin-like [Scophthalmus maximus]|uniref:Putative elastin-like n=1 Tax=Scophthalmus maximus TaxID=52904 RepID=A0A2U9B544_SCOMX|nr:putative elastin-like [Scophthalmus maximus]